MSSSYIEELLDEADDSEDGDDAEDVVEIVGIEVDEYTYGVDELELDS